jgi:hypothetical protein
MKQTRTMILALAVVAIIVGCSRPVQTKPAARSQVQVTPSGELTYPESVTPEQRLLLTQLGDLKWFTSIATKEYRERTEREFAQLLDKIQTAGLPKIASPEDIQVSPSEIRNRSDRDVLIVLQHETGYDVAVRTHWLPVGKSIPNRSAFAGWGKVWIIAPKIKEDTEPTVRGDGEPAPQP